MVRQLIALGANVDMRDCEDEKALHYALTGNNLDTLDRRRLDCAKVLAEVEAEARKARGEKADLHEVLELAQSELRGKLEGAPQPHAFRRGSSKHRLGLSSTALTEMTSGVRVAPAGIAFGIDPSVAFEPFRRGGRGDALLVGHVCYVC